MAVIYTIAHPFTNEIVYVGCTRSLSGRIRAHIVSKSETPLSKWIQELVNSYIIPKVETLDIVDSDEAMYFEGFWIHQLQSWGFKLFNNYKSIKHRITPVRYVPKKREISTSTKGRFVKKTPEQWAEQRRIRNEQKALLKAQKADNRKWKLSSFQIGKTYEIPLQKRCSFRETFRQYAIQFNIERHLTSTCDGKTIIFTVEDGKREYLEGFGRTKSGTKRYKPLLNKPKKIYPKKREIKRYGYQKAKIGDEITIDILKWDSFRNSFSEYNKKNENKIHIRYRPSDDCTKIIVTIVSPDEKNIKNVPTPTKLTRPFKQSA